jgi:lipopolysaccharide/colanic/teichoic acid biosynthesis glycosyltransferase
LPHLVFRGISESPLFLKFLPSPRAFFAGALALDGFFADGVHMSIREMFAAIMFKRLFDFILALAGLALLSPVLLAIAVLIKMDSAGPVLFRQRRVGRGLRCFTLFKFRTMIPAHGGQEITVADDHRITRLGRLLRLAKLDELPQLWNILAGDMSFVGPRPLVESTVNRFQNDYRWILGNSSGRHRPCFHQVSP